MFAYADAMCAERADEPRDDLMSVLLHAEVDGERLTQMQLAVFFMLLQNAGSETTRNLITTGTLSLLERPEQLERLRDDPELLPVAIEELLRHATPVMSFTRVATKDTEVGGQAIAEGDHVLMVYASANRDERAFDRPDDIDIRRDPERPRRVRRRRPALLPRLAPGPARGPVDVRSDPHPLRGARADGRSGVAPPRQLEPHRRSGRDARPLERGAVMRAVTMRHGHLELKDIPEPPMTDDHLLVEPLSAGVCGGDLNAMDHADDFLHASRASGTPLFLFDPDRDLVFGHEFTGARRARSAPTSRATQPATCCSCHRRSSTPPGSCTASGTPPTTPARSPSRSWCRRTGT